MDFNEYQARANTLHRYTRTKLSRKLKSSSKWQRHLKEQKEQFKEEIIKQETEIEEYNRLTGQDIKEMIKYGKQ